MVTNAYSPSTQESKAEGLWVQGQPVLHRETLIQKTNKKAYLSEDSIQ